MTVHSLQQQPRTSSLHFLATEEVTHTEATTTKQAVYPGFTPGSRLPAYTGKDVRGSLVLAFVTYSATTIKRTTTCSFSLSESLPRTKGPLQKLKEDGQRDSTSVTFSWKQTMTYSVTTTTVAVFYFGFVLRGAQATRRAVAPPPMPSPAPVLASKQLTTTHEPAAPAKLSVKPAVQDANVSPAATGSPNPFEPYKTWGRSNWQDLPFDARKHRYQVSNAQDRSKGMDVRLKGLTKSIHLTPRPDRSNDCIDEDGLTFTGVDAVGNVHRIPFSDVDRLTVV